MIDIDHTWCDDDAAAESAIAIMRLTTAPQDEQDRVAACAVAACDLISQYLDRGTTFGAPGVAPDGLKAAHVQLTVELYRRKDVPFGTTNSWSADDTPLTINGDPLRSVISMLLPYKERWPVG